MYHVLKVYKSGASYIVSPNSAAMGYEVAVVLLQQYRKSESSESISYKLCKVVED